MTQNIYVLVGPLPDMIQPSSDCRTVVIALEGKPFARNGELIDPEGGVGLLKFQDFNISASNYSYKRLDFTRYNDRYDLCPLPFDIFVLKKKFINFSDNLYWVFFWGQMTKLHILPCSYTLDTVVLYFFK